MTDETLRNLEARLRGHAGFDVSASILDGAPSPLASAVLGDNADDVEAAIAEVLSVLERLNGILRDRDGGEPSLPVSMIYAFEECARMLRESRWSSRECDLRTAWLAVLAGDIDAIVEHVELQRWAAARAES